eukprot:TRINITY_DN8522_c0_g2_i1.p1 TRINITY_DN8522_c0_g2~~TRINITY_DN8522_c0_g2_i1.p1  ORF type:complete len:826 (+),score=355.88 TRINITY_DN8522_c0_g2_i1:43-2520(+)
MAVPAPECLNGCFQITVHQAKNLPKTDNMGFSAGDPYLILKDCRKNQLLKTATVRKSTDPKWNETVLVSVVECSKFIFQVYDQDPTADDLMCDTTLDADSKMLKQVQNNQTAEGWVPLNRRGAEVFITIRPCYHQQKGHLDVHNTRFQAHPGCRITLFQCAHIGSERNYLPTVNVLSGVHPGHGKGLYAAPSQAFHQDDNNTACPREYVPRNCWEELYVSILEAQEVIYIVGWSVNVEIPLLREHDVKVRGYENIDGRNISLGDLLKMKSQEGVCICIMVWREATSNATLGMDGVVGTFSEQTRAFFAKTKVVVKTFLRLNESSLHMVAFTHHQKYVVCDAPALLTPNGTPPRAPRRLIAFLGGIDLTKGRFETPRKHLYGKNDSWYLSGNDYYQNCVVGAEWNRDARQPWQDIHAKIEGPMARDLITNFTERWEKQTTSQGSRDALYPFAQKIEQGRVLRVEDDVISDPAHPEAWHAQLFRSIDHHSSSGVNGVEGGIHNAYEHAITKAKRFIYVENQYFMGGSKEWDKAVKESKRANWLHKVQAVLSGADELQAVNRVPLLLVQRILKAIDEKKPFAVYVCIPLFPEGLPETAAMQEVIYWEFRTMEMMYRIITDHLNVRRMPGKATDYLNFFCLGTREPLGPGQPDPGIGQGKTRRHYVAASRRHMIYVHSKMLIADDDYIIVGSANINDRSMAGDRDTEIAFGAYQPNQSRDKNVPYANGSIHGFRLCLWGEHLNEGNKVNDLLYYPESKECVDYINQKAGRSWQQHAAQHPMQQDCHLMKWPIVVREDGSVHSIMKEFPDAPGALITGAESQSIPDFMTS